MSIQSQIVALEKLATLDEELAKLDEELEKERLALGDKRDQLEVLAGKLAATESSIQEMERVRSDLVTEARQMSVQMERSREKLMRCRTEREANAAQREVEEMRKLFRDRELEIQKLATLIEQARADSEATDSQRKVVSGELGASQGDLETRMGQLEAQSKELRERRKAFVADVPVVLYRRYEMIRQRRGSGLCHTTTGTCSACHIALSPMMFQTLRRSESLDQCPSCNRIIYFKPEEPQPEVAEDGQVAEHDEESATGEPASAENGA